MMSERLSSPFMCVYKHLYSLYCIFIGRQAVFQYGSISDRPLSTHQRLFGYQGQDPIRHLKEGPRDGTLS